MIIKSYEIKKNKLSILKNNFFLLYGENLGLKKEIKNFIINEVKLKNGNLEILSLYESEIINNQDNFFNLIYSGSLFSQKKMIIIYESTDKIIDIIKGTYKKHSKDIYLIFFSNLLDKKSKLKVFFEKEKKMKKY